VNRRASVQAARLRLRAIQDDILALDDGGYRAVLEVQGTVNPLADEARQESLLASFAMFLNALTYPVQILLRASPLDVSHYAARLEEHAQRVLDGPLAALARDHAAFVQGLARQRTLLERHCYVVVPAESTTRRGWLTRWSSASKPGGGDEPEWAAARRQLGFRCDEVARQLARCDLGVRRLQDQELAQLLVGCWSPERARAQRFRQQLDDYTTLAVRGSSGE
jgi:hypothetical protein